MSKRDRPEQRLCIEFAARIRLLEYYSQLKDVLWFFIPMGQSAGKSRLSRQVAGHIDKLMGARAGVADYFFKAPHKTQILFLEAKIKTGVQSEAQKNFQIAVEKRGDMYKIFKTVEEGIDIVINYIQ